VAGRLFVVGTPVGNLEDITLRALRVLGEVAAIACEDTRQTLKILNRYGIRKPLLSYFQPQEGRRIPEIIGLLEEGKDVALVSDAGTPLVSDPGFRLVKEVIAAGHRVFPIPGPSAALAALTLAGLPTDRFLFAGFPPPKGGARRTFLAEVASIHATLIFYESGPRLRASLTDMVAVLGDREAVVARELTKLFETAVRGRLSALAVDPRLDAPKGEIVILVGPGAEQVSTAEDADAALAEALTRLPPGEAASEVAKALGLNRRDLYRRAMALKDDR